MIGYLELLAALGVIVLAFALRFRARAGKHGIIVVSGRRPEGPVFLRGATWLVPLLETAQRIDLRPWELHVDSAGESVRVRAMLADDPAALERAATRLFGQPREARERLVREVIQGELTAHLREREDIDGEELSRALGSALAELGVRCELTSVNDPR